MTNVFVLRHYVYVIHGGNMLLQVETIILFIPQFLFYNKL